MERGQRRDREDGEETEGIERGQRNRNRFNWSNVLYLGYLMPLARTPWQVFSSVVIGYFLPFLNVNNGKQTQTGYTIHLYFSFLFIIYEFAKCPIFT